MAKGYTFIKLDEDSKRLIEKEFQYLIRYYEKNRWLKHIHHVTINFGSDKIPEEFDYQIGETINFKVIGMGISDKAFALLVNLKTSNEFSHITIMVSPDGKPKDSNNTAFQEIETLNLDVKGTISNMTFTKKENNYIILNYDNFTLNKYID